MTEILKSFNWSFFAAVFVLTAGAIIVVRLLLKTKKDVRVGNVYLGSERRKTAPNKYIVEKTEFLDNEIFDLKEALIHKQRKEMIDYFFLIKETVLTGLEKDLIAYCKAKKIKLEKNVRTSRPILFMDGIISLINMENYKTIEDRIQENNYFEYRNKGKEWEKYKKQKEKKYTDKSKAIFGQKYTKEIGIMPFSYHITHSFPDTEKALKKVIDQLEDQMLHLAVVAYKKIQVLKKEKEELKKT